MHVATATDHVTPSPTTATPVASPVAATRGESPAPGSAAATRQAYADWRREQAIFDATPPYVLPQNAGDLHDAREAFIAAVDAELDARPLPQGPYVDEAARIEAAATPLLRRYEGMPQAIAVVREAVAQRQAETPLSDRPAVAALLADAGGGGDADAVLDTLADGLDGLTASDREYLLTSPELGALLREHVEPYVSEQYGELDGDLSGRDDTYDVVTAANTSAGRLAQLTSDLPPEMVQVVLESNLDTVSRIAQLSPMYLGPPEKHGGTAFEDLSRAVGRLGDTPEADRLRDDIATIFAARPLEKGEGYPMEAALVDAVRNGASPALALAVVAQLANGDDYARDVAISATGGLVEAGGAFAEGLREDLDLYQRRFAELGSLLDGTGGLPPEATQAAIEDWMRRQEEASPGWAEDNAAFEDALLANARQVQDLLAGVAALRPELRDPVDGDLRDLANSDEVLQAMTFAAGRDRSFLTSPEADVLAALADPARASAGGADALRQLGNHMVREQATAIFRDLEAGNPASVSEANARLRTLGERVSGMFGGDAAAWRAAIGHLEAFTALPPDATPAQVEAVTRGFDRNLDSLEGFQRNTAQGIALRSIGVVASLMAVHKYSGQYQTEGELRDAVAVVGSYAGLGAATISLLQKAQPVEAGALDDAADRLGPRSVANLTRVLGVASAAGDVAYLVDALGEEDYVEAGLHGLAGAGTVLLSVSSGPAGWVTGAALIAVSMAGQSTLSEFRAQDEAAEASYHFLVAAGVAPEVADILKDGGADEGFASEPAWPLLLEVAARGELVGHVGEPLDAAETLRALNAMAGDDAMLDALRDLVFGLRSLASGGTQVE